MLDIQIIRHDPERVRHALTSRGWSATDIVDRVLEHEAKRREALTRHQHIQAEANTVARTIGRLMRSGRRDEAQDQIAAQAKYKLHTRELEERVRILDAELHKLLLAIPNIPHESVPLGSGPQDNARVLAPEHLPEFSFTPLPHWALAKRHGLVDFERGAKVAGAGFPFYVGKGARLQRALIQFFLDSAGHAGYTEIQPPLMVNAASAQGTGQLPDKEGQMYAVRSDELFAIPTAEVPLTNYYRDEVLEEKALPVRLCAHTPCWRREAGSYGKNVRGLNRLHQFDKVELVHITHPGRSYEALEALCSQSERLVAALRLPYRKLYMCTGDMGFNQAAQYDLEVWSAGQGQWLEVSSVSNFTDYQARRMRIRYRPAEGGKPKLVHTINGSALALPRIVAALLENNQHEDGSIEIPGELRPYTGFDAID